MPTIAYPGGKARLAQKIVSFLPKRGRIYVEPFAGRGNIYWAAASGGLQYREWWLNDIATSRFFHAIGRIGRSLEVPTRSRAEFERQRAAQQSGDLAAVLLEPYLSFSGGGYIEAGCRGGAECGEDDGGCSAVGYTKTIRECHSIMHKTKPRLTSQDWKKMGLEDLGSQDTVVLDPPYPNSNIRSYSEHSVDYESLVDLLLRAKFRWILCGYAHPVLQRLGKPFWARDVQLLSVRVQAGQEDRTECLWSNFASRARNHVLPPALSSRLRTLADAASLSFPALNARIDEGLEIVAKDWNAIVPYLLEMNRRLSAPGKRTDLRKGAPAGLTWTAWVESKRSKIGRSLRSVQRLLRGKTEASKNWKARPHDKLALGSGTIQELSGSPMGIAFEMARLVLEMRSRSQNTSSNKRRLERLASQFLAIAERRSGQRSESPSAERVGIANPVSSLTM